MARKINPKFIKEAIELKITTRMGKIPLSWAIAGISSPSAARDRTSHSALERSRRWASVLRKSRKLGPGFTIFN